MYKLFIVLILVGCNTVDPIIGPTSSTIPSTQSDTLTVPPPVTPPTSPSRINVPIASPKNYLWNEVGPVGFSFVLNTVWGQSSEDTTALRYGWKSERFQVNPGDCFGGDCYRRPVYERKEYGESHEGFATEGDEFWYGWSFYVPYESSSNSWVFYGQFIQPPSDNSVGFDSIWMLLKRDGHPFCMVFDWVNHPNAFGMCESPNIPLIPDSDFAGKWHDIVIHIKWSHDSDKGLTEVWVDGELKGTHKGYTLTPNHLGAVVKYGVYRIANNKSTIVYYDEMRKGKTRNEVDIRMLTSP